MVEIHPTLYTFLLELVAALIAIVAWFLVDTIKRRNRDRKVVSIIIDKVKQDDTFANNVVMLHTFRWP